MPPLHDLPTPAALVDLDRLDANLRRMQDYADGHGLRLRPHIKTHKARWIAEEQLRLGATGLTVATPVEAARIGTAAPETLVAYPPFGPRADALAAVIAEAPDATDFLVGLDSVAAVDSLRGALDRAGATAPVGVLVEVDLGMRRVGVATAAEAAAIAGACGDGVAYRGIMFYPGHIRQPVAEQTRDLERLAADLDAVVTELGDRDLAPGIVSGGSTPTAFRSHEVPAQTEIRAGTYVFNDRTTAAMGACRWDDCAYTILATVISTAVPGQAVVDAGTKSLSGDPIRASGYGGYGQLLCRPEVTVARKSEEHGILDLSETDWRPSLGERVRIIPNHVCVSVNLQRRVWGVRDGTIERVWEVGAKNWYAAEG
ncbi:MAG: alanine racemase [Candidatus Longimicrobiales bacterium M2_2A_002]